MAGAGFKPYTLLWADGNQEVRERLTLAMSRVLSAGEFLSFMEQVVLGDEATFRQEAAIANQEMVDAKRLAENVERVALGRKHEIDGLRADNDRLSNYNRVLQEDANIARDELSECRLTIAGLADEIEFLKGQAAKAVDGEIRALNAVTANRATIDCLLAEINDVRKQLSDERTLGSRFEGATINLQARVGNLERELIRAGIDPYMV